MKKTIIALSVLIYIFFLFSSCCTINPPEFWAEGSKERFSLPDWIVRYPGQAYTAGPEAVLEWKLLARSYDRDSGNKESWPTCAVAALPVTGDTPLVIEVSSTKGYPVIMITDRPLHSHDSFVFYNEDEESLPAHPVAYTEGREFFASMDFVSPYSAVFQVWVWVLHGPLEQVESELDILSGLFDGLTSGEYKAMVAMSQQPEVVRAWYGSEITHSGNKWKYTKTSLTVSTGGQGETEPEDILGIWIKNTLGENQQESFKQAETWKESLSNIAVNKSEALTRGRQWKSNNITIADSLENSYHVQVLKTWTSHPAFQGILLQRTWEKQFFSSPESADLYHKGEMGLHGGESLILSGHVSELLSGMLTHVAGLDAALFDSRGNIVAATSPFLIINPGENELWEDFTWDTDVPGGYLATLPYTIPGIGFKVIKIMIPVKNTKNDLVIGWLAAEIYGE